MEFNDTKCHHLHIGKHDFGHNYTMEPQKGESEITRVDSEKELGVIIDKKMTFREQISTKINIANVGLGQLSWMGIRLVIRRFWV